MALLISLLSLISLAFSNFQFQPHSANHPSDNMAYDGCERDGGLCAMN